MSASPSQSQVHSASTTTTTTPADLSSIKEPEPTHAELLHEHPAHLESEGRLAVFGWDPSDSSSDALEWCVVCFSLLMNIFLIFTLMLLQGIQKPDKRRRQAHDCKCFVAPLQRDHARRVHRSHGYFHRRAVHACIDCSTRHEGGAEVGSGVAASYSRFP